jgi:hypothetical protein
MTVVGNSCKTIYFRKVIKESTAYEYGDTALIDVLVSKCSEHLHEVIYHYSSDHMHSLRKQTFVTDNMA